MSTLYDLVNVYEKGTGNWLGQCLSEKVAKDWLKQTGKVPTAHIICKNRPVDGKFPEGEDVRTTESTHSE